MGAPCTVHLRAALQRAYSQPADVFALPSGERQLRQYLLSHAGGVKEQPRRRLSATCRPQLTLDSSCQMCHSRPIVWFHWSPSSGVWASCKCLEWFAESSPLCCQLRFLWLSAVRRRHLSLAHRCLELKESGRNPASASYDIIDM